MRLDLSKAPYYQKEKNADNTQLLFKPGTYVQNQELNELQAINKRIIKDIADSVLQDGDILTGCQLIITDNLVTLTSGKIYIEGIVRTVKEQSKTITRRGSEVVGVKLDKRVTTSQDDENLLSPASGFESYGLSASDRLTESVIITINDDTATPLYLLEEGILINQVQNEDGTLIERFMSTLARRTYDESGHYKVWGFELAQKTQYDDKKLYLTMSEGKAYVEGWEIDKATATTIPIDKSTDTRLIKGEPKVHTDESVKYKLNNAPVAHIERVMAEVSVSTTLTRQGAINGSDPIPARYSPVVDIQSITQTDGTLYTKNVDYVLEANTVRWLGSGTKQPDIGATYNISFTYNKDMIQGMDYKLTIDNNEYFVELISGGDKPVNNTQMQIDYTFYLHYMASITLDKTGALRVVKGQPDTVLNVSEPNINDQGVLLMGHITISPLNDELKIVNTNNIRTSMSQIQKMYERLEDMEINQAITDLDKEALDGEDATLLRGILTDGFLGFSKADVNHPDYNASINTAAHFLTLGYEETVHDLIINATKSDDYTAYERILTAESDEKILDSQPHATQEHMINPYTDYVYANKPYRNITVVPISGATITTTPSGQAKEGDIVTVNVDVTGENLEFREILIDGAYMSGNSFTMPDKNVTVTAALKDVTPIPPPNQDIIIIPVEHSEITTTPSFIAKEGQVVTINVKETKKDIILDKIIVNGSPISGDSFTMPNHSATVTVTMKDVAPKVPPTIKISPAIDNWIDTKRVVVQRDGGIQVKNVNFGVDGARSTSTSSKTNVANSAIQFMRSRRIDIVSQRFKDNQDDIVVYFNDIKMNATATEPKYVGSKSGYLKADDTGMVKCHITVPSNTRCGTVNVKIFTEEYTHMVGNTPYTANGTLKTTTVTNTTTTTVNRRIPPPPPPPAPPAPPRPEPPRPESPRPEPSEPTISFWERPGWTSSDPVAQTFVFGDDHLLSSVGIFLNEAEVNQDITLQIRETENGYPSDVVLAEKVLTAEEIKNSNDSSAETKIQLFNPVLCKAGEQYAMTILTDSPIPKIFIQELGKRDLISNEQIVQNPYIPGLMFSSSNGLAWTAHQTQNIKFNLYCNKFTETTTVYFNPIQGIDYDGIKLIADTSVPIDCKLEWEYSSDNETSWLPISINRFIGLSRNIKNITIRVTFKSMENIAPQIALDSLLLVGYKHHENSSHISRNVTTDNKFTNIKFVADVYTPSGTGVLFYYATDIEGIDWKPLEQEGEGKVKQVGGYTEFTYVSTELEGKKNFRFKVDLTTNNSTVKPEVKSLKCIMK